MCMQQCIQTCIECCARCAHDCEGLKGDEQMDACAAICRQCARSCRDNDAYGRLSPAATGFGRAAPA
jgi:hypothetical protein